MSSPKLSETWISRSRVVDCCPVCDGEWYEHASECPEVDAKPASIVGAAEEFVSTLTGEPLDVRYTRKQKGEPS